MNRIAVLPTFFIHILSIGSVCISLNAGAQKLLLKASGAISTNTYSSVYPEGKGSNRTDIAFGVETEFPLFKKIIIQTGIDYISKGYNFKANGKLYETSPYTFTCDYEFKHNYLVVPVMLKWHFGHDNFQPYSNIGGYIGYGLGGTWGGTSSSFDTNGVPFDTRLYDSKIKYGERPIGLPLKNTDKYYKNRVDFGFSLGAGVLLFKLVALDFRYDLGQRNIDEGFGDYKNRTMLFGIMMPISLKKSK